MPVVHHSLPAVEILLSSSSLMSFWFWFWVLKLMLTKTWQLSVERAVFVMDFTAFVLSLAFLSPYRATSADRTPTAAGRWAHILAHSAECQFNHWGWTHYPERSGVPNDIWDLDRNPRCQCTDLQAVAPGPWHRVWDSGVAHQTRRRWDWAAGTTTHHQDQMCWWVLLWTNKQTNKTVVI